MSHGWAGSPGYSSVRLRALGLLIVRVQGLKFGAFVA